MEVAKAVGGSFKVVRLVPKTVREMTQLLRGVFLANNLASNDNLTRTTKRQITQNENEQYNKKINTNTVKNMLRYKTKIRLSLVGLYDIWPGNGAGPFLQPRTSHGLNSQ